MGGMSQCNDGSYVAGVYRNHCDKLYCLEMAKCCKQTGVDTVTHTAYDSKWGDCYNHNWWSSFDKDGWSRCTKHGKGYKYIDGIFRNHCNKLYCIEEVSCSTSPHHNEEQKCVSANWWSS